MELGRREDRAHMGLGLTVATTTGSCAPLWDRQSITRLFRSELAKQTSSIAGPGALHSCPFSAESPAAAAEGIGCSGGHFGTAVPLGIGHLRIGLSNIAGFWLDGAQSNLHMTLVLWVKSVGIA